MSHLLLEPKHRKTPTAPSRDIITNDVATHYNITINAISLRPVTTQYKPPPNAYEKTRHVHLYNLYNSPIKYKDSQSAHYTFKVYADANHNIHNSSPQNIRENGEVCQPAHPIA